MPQHQDICGHGAAALLSTRWVGGRAGVLRAGHPHALLWNGTGTCAVTHTHPHVGPFVDAAAIMSHRVLLMRCCQPSPGVNLGTCPPEDTEAIRAVFGGGDVKRTLALGLAGIDSEVGHRTALQHARNHCPRISQIGCGAQHGFKEKCALSRRGGGAVLRSAQHLQCQNYRHMHGQDDESHLYP